MIDGKEAADSFIAGMFSMMKTIEETNVALSKTNRLCYSVTTRCFRLGITVMTVCTYQCPKVQKL
jgi:hypothetical protein